MKYVTPLPAQPFLKVAGSTHRFPVRRIYCVGRNYAAHAIEMGSDPEREDPFFFQKNPDNLVINNENFPYPPRSSDVHHEVELVVALGGLPDDGLSDIDVANALQYAWGYTVGLDMTRRDLQAQCKEARRPWEIGKSFEQSAPCGELKPAASIGHPESGKIELKINNEVRQEGDLNQQIWKVPEIISYLSGLFVLRSGDLIMTGTPSGVGAVKRGDTLEATIEGIGELHCSVV